jgi:hypothetical protein
MGDRADVTLTVTQAGYNAMKLLNLTEYDSAHNMADGTVELYYEQCNYADLGFENVLVTNCICYDKSWTEGDDFSEGIEHFRVLSDGTEELKTFYSNDAITFYVSEVEKAANQGIEKVLELLTKKKARTTIAPFNDAAIKLITLLIPNT